MLKHLKNQTYSAAILIATLLIMGNLDALNQNKANTLVNSAFEDYQRNNILIEKIELLELIEDQLMPLTDNEILDSKMHDLLSYRQGINEMLESYARIKKGLEKYSRSNNSDIKALYDGTASFLDIQEYILKNIAKAIDEHPEAKSIDFLHDINLGSSRDFATLKFKNSSKEKKFSEALVKVRMEIESYESV